MKRVLLLILTCLLATALFAGCGANTGGSTSTTGTGATTSVRKSNTTKAPVSDGKSKNAAIIEAYFNDLDDGHYHMRSSSDGHHFTDIYASGGKKATVMEADGKVTRVVFKDGKVYELDGSTKTYRVNEMPDVPGGKVANQDAKFLKSDKAIFAGEMLEYSEYETAVGSQMQVFVKDGAVKGIRTITAEEPIDIVYEVIDDEIPEDIFDIPTDYTKK